MIRIYLDWGVISNLKKPEFSDLKLFIDSNREALQFPFSPAHFTDLMKSHNPDNEYFGMDLESLSTLSKNHLMRWEENRTMPLVGTPEEYFEGEKKRGDDKSPIDIEKVYKELDEVGDELGISNVGSQMKSLYQSQPTGIELNDENRRHLKKMFPSINSSSSMWDLMKEIAPFSKKLFYDKEFYKDYRKTLREVGFELDSNHGNWSEEEVIGNLDISLSKLGTELTFLEYVKSSIELRNEEVNRYNYFTSAYIMLDLIGYKSDKLKKTTDSMQNIYTDGEHAFYGAHCDYFVVIDKNLKDKTKVLYNKLGIPTEVITPSELIGTLSKTIHAIPMKGDPFLTEALSFINNEYVEESFPSSGDDDVEFHTIKLPKFYFNFFNYMIYSIYPSIEGIALTFKRVFKNYSDFIYYTEVESLIHNITSCFGYDDLEDLKTKTKEFVQGNEDTFIIWQFEGGQIRLGIDSETRRPILSYVLSTREKGATNST